MKNILNRNRNTLTSSQKVRPEQLLKAGVFTVLNKTHCGCGFCKWFGFCEKIKNVKRETNYCQWPENMFKSMEQVK